MGGRVAVFGAAGFLGRSVVARLVGEGFSVRAVTRQGSTVGDAHENAASGDLLVARLVDLIQNCDIIVNCAARVHVVTRERANAAEAAYQAMNVDFPVRLAEVAKASGVRRFIQLSSLAAIGSLTAPGSQVDDASIPHPDTPYGRSKLIADEALRRLRSTSFAVISLRPPTIYGPGVGAFFAKLDRAARIGIPLPLAGIHNRRSLAYVDNIADAVACAVRGGPSGCYLLSDSAPISSAELYTRLLRLHGHGDRTFSLPAPIVWSAARALLGSRAASLLGSAAVDGRRFAATFGWQPVIPLDLALSRTISGSG